MSRMRATSKHSRWLRYQEWVKKGQTLLPGLFRAVPLVLYAEAMANVCPIAMTERLSIAMPVACTWSRGFRLNSPKPHVQRGPEALLLLGLSVGVEYGSQKLGKLKRDPHCNLNIT